MAFSRNKLLVLLGASCAAILAGSAVFSAPASHNFAIVGATVFDATGAAPRVETVLIRDGRIAGVGPNLSIPGGFTRINAAGEALVPGFFDLHTHWTAGGEPATTPAIANADVSTGITTVADFNSAPEAFSARRLWLSKLVAPHVEMCGRLSTPGGHGADWADTATTKWVTTPDGARVGVDAIMPYKPDCLGEVMTDGWRYGTSPDDTSMNEDALTALVDEAHKNHIPVLTHTLRIEKGAEAGRAKVDVIDHALQDRDIDDATIQAIKQGGSYFAPTLAVYEPNKPGRRMTFPPSDPRYVQGMRKWEFALHNTKRLYDAGVPIALGTDSGMPATPHGKSSLREMELLVQAGLPPTAALMAGTANSAKVMGLLADRGTIEKGKRADLVLLKGKPWENIADVEKTDRVFIDGALVFGPGGAPPNPVVPPPSVQVAALVDDFERSDMRSNLDTLVVTEPDGGIDRSTEMVDLIPRENGGHALMMEAKMAVKPDGQAAIVIPLTAGSIVPADIRKYKGVKMDIRGDGGPYEVVFNTLAGPWETSVNGEDKWQTVMVPFSQLKHSKGRAEFASDDWTGNNATEIEIKAHRKGGEKAWLELDNVSFY